MRKEGRPWPTKIRMLGENKFKKRVVCLMMAMLVLFVNSFAFAAESGAVSELFKKVSQVISDIGNEIIGISTVVAVLGLVIALFTKLLSRNTRAIEEANAWIKRIIISWVILNSLTLFLKYGQEIVADLSGGQNAFDVATGGGGN